jgi:5-methylcytosine-specific restriction endonuclease McrA
MLRPCLRCGTLTDHGSYCAAHTRRNGATRAWRKVRAQVLDRDGWTCQLCGAPATDADHFQTVSDGGGNEPSNLRALCAGCNRSNPN